MKVFLMITYDFFSFLSPFMRFYIQPLLMKIQNDVNSVKTASKNIVASVVVKLLSNSVILASSPFSAF